MSATDRNLTAAHAEVKAEIARTDTKTALLLAAAGLLLRSVRPHLGGRHGFPLWATLAAEEIGAAVSGSLAADIAGLSRLAVAKFTCLRRAVDLTLTGGALLILAALITAGGSL